MSKDLGGVTEAVARAIVDNDLNWNNWPPEYREPFLEKARRAIAAMQAAAPAGGGERYREALRDISRQFETDFVLGDKIVDSPPRSFVIAYETARAALHPEPAASDVERNIRLDVILRATADEHADVLRPKQIDALYEAAVVLRALAPEAAAPAGDRELVEQIISAWAFAHDIDGAARNDLFARLRAITPEAAASDQVKP